MGSQRFLLLFFMSLAELATPATPDTEKRIDALLARMTLEEKLGQMSQSTSMQTPLSDDLKQQIRKGRWGSFMNAGLPAGSRRSATNCRKGKPARNSAAVRAGCHSWISHGVPDPARAGRQLESRTDREGRGAGRQEKRARKGSTGPSPRCWISRAIRDGAESRKRSARILAHRTTRSRDDPGFQGKSSGHPGIGGGLRQTLRGIRRGGSGTRLQLNVHLRKSAPRSLSAAVSRGSPAPVSRRS